VAELRVGEACLRNERSFCFGSHGFNEEFTGVGPEAFRHHGTQHLPVPFGVLAVEEVGEAKGCRFDVAQEGAHRYGGLIIGLLSGHDPANSSPGSCLERSSGASGPFSRHLGRSAAKSSVSKVRTHSQR
jgi:hypothetical protein